MSDLLSGQISFSGLGSGTDFNQIVEQLKVVESIPHRRMEQQKDKFTKRVEALDDILEAMEEAKEALDNLRSRDKFAPKTVDIKDDSFLSATADGDAKDNNYRIEITHVAERSAATPKTLPDGSALDPPNTAYEKEDSPVAHIGDFRYSMQTGVEPDGTAIIETRTVKVGEGMTLKQLAHAVNTAGDNPGMEMIVNDNGKGTTSVSFRSKETGEEQEITIEDTLPADDSTIPPTVPHNVLGIQFDTSNKGQNSKYSVNNIDFEDASNNVTIAEGVDIEFFDTGTTTISIKTDKEKVKENIQEFLDVINGVLKEIDSHVNINTKDKEKKDEDTLSDVNDPTEDVLSSYLKDLVSSAPTVKGNTLSGEYGVTALERSISSMMSATGLGFMRSSKADGSDGDIIASLSEMGISINSREGDKNFGLFEIAPASTYVDHESDDGEMKGDDLQLGSQARFDNYIDNNMDDVIDFFAASDKIETTSTGFFTGSYLPGKVQAGIYDVAYEVGPGGNIVDGSVFIGGKPAAAVEGNPLAFIAAYDASGIATMRIDITDLTAGKHNEHIKVQQGKIAELANKLDSELKPYIKPTSTPGREYYPDNSATAILRNGYLDSEKSIDEQLWKEEARLDNWEVRKKLEFARLETLLSKYNNMADSMAAQLGQLMG